MAIIRQTVFLAPKDGSRFQRVIATVSAANSYSVMPSALLEMLGIEPQWTSTFSGADESQTEHSVAEVAVRIDDRERATICVFGEANCTPVLGKYTLDGFGLTVDQGAGKLAPATLVLE